MEHIDNFSEPVAEYGVESTNKVMAKAAIMPEGCIPVEQYFDTLRAMIKKGYADI